jgi:hypothetical protein
LFKRLQAKNQAAQPAEMSFLHAFCQNAVKLNAENKKDPLRIYQIPRYSLVFSACNRYKAAKTREQELTKTII